MMTNLFLQIFEGCGKPRGQAVGPGSVRGKRSADNSSVVDMPPVHRRKLDKKTGHPQSDRSQKNPYGKLNFGAGEVVPESGDDAASKKNPYDQHFIGQYTPPEGKNVKPTTAAGTSLDRLVRDIKDKVKTAKDFWIQLPYSVCNDDDIAAQPDNDDECWNGQDRARFVVIYITLQTMLYTREVTQLKINKTFNHFKVLIQSFRTFVVQWQKTDKNCLGPIK